MVTATLQVLAKKVGVKLADRDTLEAHVFDGETLATKYRGKPLDESSILHEICHYLAASPEQRDLPEFGLGFVALFGQAYVPNVVDLDSSVPANSEANTQEHVTHMLAIYLGMKYDISPVMSDEPGYADTWETYLINKVDDLATSNVHKWEVIGRSIHIIQTCGL